MMQLRRLIIQNFERLLYFSLGIFFTILVYVYNSKHFSSEKEVLDVRATASRLSDAEFLVETTDKIEDEVLQTISLTETDVNDLQSLDSTSTQNENYNNNPTKVLIITSYRSGSTFLGELFNQHDDSFYFFEPLVVLDESSNKGSTEIQYSSAYSRASSVTDSDYAAKLLLLQKLLSCDLPQYTWGTKFKMGNGLMSKNMNVTVAKLNINPENKYQPRTTKGSCAAGVCFRQKSRKLCLPPFCNYDYQDVLKTTGSSFEHMCNRNCGWINAEITRKMCKESKNISAKLIRFCDISQLSVLFEVFPDLSLIVQVRDPRALYLSRYMRAVQQKLYGNFSLKDMSLAQAKVTCDCALKNYKTYKHWQKSEDDDSSKNSKKSIKILRYEDLSTAPLELATTLHNDLSKLPMTENLKTWIIENTTNDGRDPYSSTRNSTKTANEKWRISNKNNDDFFVEILKVQEVCSEMMEIYGYKKVSSREELYDLSFNLVEEVSF